MFDLTYETMYAYVIHNHRYIAWFSLNVSVIATNRSCLLARMLVRFAGFHKQQSCGLLRGLLYLETCKLRIAFGI